MVTAGRSDLGPLDGFLADPGVSAILVNGPRDIYIERDGHLTRAEAELADDAELLSIIREAARRAGATIDESSPLLDARLPDGTVLNAVIPPLALDGPVLSLRRPDVGATLEQLVATRALSRVTASFLAACVRAKCAILIAGSAGSGKSTLLQGLVGCIPETDRVATIEEVPEIKPGRARNAVRMEMPADGNERQALIAQATQMGADRVILGDLRSSEAAALVDALSTTTHGAIATIHAASPVNALSRLESLISDARPGSRASSVRRAIASTIDIVVHVAQSSDRCRRVISIGEPTLVDGRLGVVELFRYDAATGRWIGTGHRPKVLDRMAAEGIDVPDRIFEAEPATPPKDPRDEQIAALRTQVEELKKAREVRLSSLLGFVDVADAIRQLPIADDRVRQGVDVLHQRLDGLLAAFGFEPVATPGMPLDESSHEVVGGSDQSDSVPKRIAAVRRRGFRVQGELVRKAKVVVGDPGTTHDSA